MGEIMLKVENISKQYRLGLVGASTLGHDMKRWWYKVRGKDDPFLKVGDVNDRSVSGESDYVWALKDINFEVKQGEVLGIIGKNGAGKSTLLKILSRVTGPTTGVIKSKGKIASLLEVGTGFHPELTGRENIYLNGAILGMTKAEIKQKEDEIIAFSGCERYVDTPVKRYSSGMRVRLAFAVAAFLEPDILVIDEVLAVGDAEFQKKAVGKMQDISKGEGRTVLFVSHNMAAVKSLCSRAVVLENGKIVFKGNTEEAVGFYLRGGSGKGNQVIFKKPIKNNLFSLKEIKISNKGKSSNDHIVENSPIVLITRFDLNSELPTNYHITYHLYNEMGDNMFAFTHWRDGLKLSRGDNRLICEIPAHFLQSGQYFLTFMLIKDNKKAEITEKDVLSFVVVDGDREIGTYMGKEPGYIRPKFRWYYE